MNQISDKAFLGKNVSLGRNVFIGDNAILEDHIRIGDNTIIDNVIIKSGTFNRMLY